MMDWLQFLATVISALAWPTTVVLLALAFRKDISELVSRLTNFKAKDFEAVFRKKLAGVSAPELQVENPKQDQSDLLKPPAYYSQLAIISPRAALMEAWVEVETAASAAFDRHCSPGMRVFVSPNEVLEFLKVNELVPTDDYKRARSLLELRDNAARRVDISEISTELIQTYINLALDLAQRLRRT